jgi:hypothetical protein
MIRHASLFSQLIAFFDRNKFKNLVMKHKTERYSKGFKSWNQFIAMLFCQVAQAKSIREISGGLACCIGKLRHLGVASAPSKSTLSYANKNRSWKMYHESTYAKKFPLAPGSIVTMDRGYTDYKLFAFWTAQNVYFVTRLKGNASYEVLSERELSLRRNILIELFFKAIKQNLR